MNLDEFLAQHSDSQSPQTETNLANAGSHLDNFLNAHGVDPNALTPGQDNPQQPSPTESIARAAQIGAGSTQQPALSAGLEAGAGAVQSLLTGSNNFGDQGRLAGVQNFIDNFKRAKDTQQSQVDQAFAANPKTAATAQFVSSIPRMVAETSLLGLAPSGALEGSLQSKSLSDLPGNAVKGAVTSAVLGKAFDMIGAGVKGVNAVDSGLAILGKTIGPEAQAAAAKALANDTIRQSINGAASLGALATGGGAVNVMIHNPQSWDEAVDQFKTGATVAAALGIGLKGTQGLFNWGSNIVATAVQKGRASDIASQEAAVKNAEESLRLSGQDLETSALKKGETVTKINQTQSLLDTSLTHKAKLEGVLNEAENIGKRMGTLPDRISNQLDEGLQNFGQDIQKTITFLPQNPIELKPTIDKALSAIRSVDAYTANALSAKTQAENLVKTFAKNTAQTEASLDPVLNRMIGEDTAQLTPLQLWKSKQQIQEVLYNKNFLEAARGTDLRAKLVNFEQAIRENLNQLDSSGNLAKYNDAYSGLQRTKVAFEDEGGINFFQSKALNPHDPTIYETTQAIEKHLMDSTSLKQEGVKFGGLKPETAADPIIGNRLKAIKGAIDSDASVAMSDYALLEQAKKTLPKVDAEIVRAQNALETAAAKKRLADLAIEKSSLNQSRSLESLNGAKDKLKELQSFDPHLPKVGRLGQLKEFGSNLKDSLSESGAGKAAKNLSALTTQKVIPAINQVLPAKKAQDLTRAQ